ncbi:MAG: amidase [Planctomycetes bacterium]|nr:amidase [Planctomycetota bacterium]
MLIAVAFVCCQESEPRPEPRVTRDEVAVAAKVVGLDYDADELELARRGVGDSLESFERLRAVDLANSVAPAFTFHARIPGIGAPKPWPAAIPRERATVVRPADLEELAFADLATLSELVRTRQVTATELVELSLARLKRLDPTLHCVVTLCEQRARARAAELDRELALGQWRGPLHGLPWGAKDLFATKGIRTTWGAPPFEQQRLEFDAAVVEKLDHAGAVLVAKLSLGELAMGDTWFGGLTRNPWDVSKGSSGSSAGPASATSSGCVAFAIGTETCGSIVSPSATCGVTGLRPTFGRVSRHGAMALSWTMDKVGPIARTVADCATVFAAIHGADPRDESSVDAPFVDLGTVDVRGWKVGYVPGDFGDAAIEARRLKELADLGCELVPIELPEYPLGELFVILTSEAAAAFDQLTDRGLDAALVQQDESAWPNTFRVARLAPAADYLRACRIRRLLMLDIARLFERVDVIVHPSLSGKWLVLENLTGNPSVCVPTELGAEGSPGSLSFTAAVFDDTRALAIAEAWQRATGFQLAHPSLR